MSIPHYQEASLQGENIAKRRVMQKSKKAMEGEEQRAIRSGKVIDELKTSYRTIVANLQMQLTTMNITKSTIESIIAAAAGGLTFKGDEDEGFEMSDEGSDFKVTQGNLHSLLIGTLGKLVNLASQCKVLCASLSDKVRESGRPITGSADLSKINSLLGEVADAFGSQGETGFNKGLSQMLEELSILGGAGVPDVRRLALLYIESMSECATIIERLQRNEYETDIQRVFIPSRSTDPTRRADIAAGRENREFSGEEYRLLNSLREKGLLRGDDFTSVYSGDRGDDSTIGSSSSSSSSGSSGQSSGRVFRPNRATTGIRPPRPAQRFVPGIGTVSDEDSDYQQGFSSSGSDVEIGIFEGDSDDESDDESALSSGSGLYSLPASSRYPMRIH